MPRPLHCIVHWIILTALSLAGSLRAESYEWGAVTMGGGGFVNAIIAHPAKQNLIYARTDVGGAYRWEEATKAWVPITDWLSQDELSFMGVESLTVDPRNEDRVYMVGGTSYWNQGRTGFLRSADKGETWQVIDVTAHWKSNGNGMGRQSGEKLAVDPNNGTILFYGSRRDGLFRSADTGATWQQVKGFPKSTTPNGNGIVFVVFDPSSGQAGQATPVLYAAVSRPTFNFYVSRDAGVSWQPVKDAPTGLMPQRQALAADGTMYITYAHGAGPHGDKRYDEGMDRGEVWRFGLRDGRWSEITPLGQKRPFSGVSVDAKKPGRVVVTTINTYLKQPWGYGDRIFLSEDGGRKWRDLIGENTVEMRDDGFPWIRGKAMHWAGCITLDPFNSDRAFLTSGNGIFRTETLGAAKSQWLFSSRGIEETVPMDVVSIPGGPLVSVILDYDGFVHDDIRVSPKRGAHSPGMGSVSALAVAALNPAMMARAGGQLRISTDGGVSWAESPSLPVERAGKGSLAWSADGRFLLWSPSKSNAVYRTRDLGKTWQKAEGVDFDARVVADPVNAQKFYLYRPSTGKIWASEDGGASFAVVSETTRGGSERITVVPGREGHIWLAMGGRGLAFSTRGGAGVAFVEGVTQCGAVGVGKAADGADYDTLFIWGRINDGPVGVHRSSDRGATWLRVNDDANEFGGLGNAGFVVGDANVFGCVYHSTAGRGVAVGEPKAASAVRAAEAN